jgi:hypothetical protein
MFDRLSAETCIAQIMSLIVRPREANRAGNQSAAGDRGKDEALVGVNCVAGIGPS